MSYQESIPDYVRGRLSLRVHLEQSRRQHVAGRRDHTASHGMPSPLPSCLDLADQLLDV